MLVTLAGIVMLVRLVHQVNAESPMLVTGRSLIVFVMDKAPDGRDGSPVYPVIVIVLSPLTV
jgi:hypothetical protein